MFTLARRIPSTANLWGSRSPCVGGDDEADDGEDGATTTTTRGGTTPTPPLSSPSEPNAEDSSSSSWRVDVDLDTDAQIIRAVATGVIRGLSPLEVAHIIRAPEAAPVFRIESRVPLAARDAPPDAAPQPSSSTHAQASEAALPMPAEKKEYHEEIVFLAPMRVLFWKVWTRARVRQTWRAANPRRVCSDFSLVTADLMAALKGEWVLEEVFDGGEEDAATTSSDGDGCGREGGDDENDADDADDGSSSSYASAAEDDDQDDGDDSKATTTPASRTKSSPSSSTRLTYTFEMWPKGVPGALRHVPSVMDAVRESVARQVAQTLDKVAYVAGKVGKGGGEDQEEAATAPPPPPPPTVRAWVFSSRSPSPTLAAAPVPSTKSPFAAALSLPPSPRVPPRSAASSPSASPPLCVVAAVREAAAEVRRAGSFKKLGLEEAGPVTASLNASRRASSAAAGGVPPAVVAGTAVARVQSAGAGRPPLPRRPASASFPSAANSNRNGT
jgi:hypothetical protein